MDVVGVGLTGTPSAFHALTMPPVETFPSREGSLSVEARMASLIWMCEYPGFSAFTRPAIPVTKGTAMDVPE